MSYMRPPLKWAGGKYALLDEILAVLPPGRRLVEPFAGSAVTSINAPHARIWVNDRNADLIMLYRLVKRDVDGFIRRAHRLFGPARNTREHYLERRAEFNACTQPARRAVLFYYLVAHGYNGLVRTNASGAFNVPFGRNRTPRVKTDALRALSVRLQNARITNWDFRRVMKDARAGDVLYLDPPYHSDANGFTSYTPNGFDATDQRELVALAEQLRAQGIPVVLSNNATPLMRDLCREAHVRYLDVRRSISCNSQNRRPAKEMLAAYLPR